MSGSQQSSRCRAIWNVMKRSRYMWLGRNRRGNTVMSKLTHAGNKLNTQKQVHIPTGGLLSTTHASVTPVAPVVTDTCYVEKLKSLQKSAQQEKKKTYTVLLSCLISLEENSLRMSKKAKLRGGPPSPWGLGSLNANSIPSLKNTQTERYKNSL